MRHRPILRRAILRAVGLLWLGGAFVGAADPELKPAIARANRFFGYYIGKGAIPYGEHRPGMCHDDNGKTSLAAMAFTSGARSRPTAAGRKHWRPS